MRLSVVIVSFNVSAFLEKCLQSVYKAIEGLDADVIVVDNHSRDDSVQMVKRRFPKTVLLENDKNLGFGKANNLALQQIETPYVVLLNPDTLVNEDTFKTCLLFMEKHPEAAAVGVKMFDGSGRYLPESKRGFPTPAVALSKMLGLGKIFPRSRFFNGYYLGHLDPDQVHSIDVLTGAFMFLRTEAVKEVGYFDEDYFMYGEDIDLSYRLKKADYQIYYLPESSIIHYKGESTKKASLNYLMSFYQAMLIFLEKHFNSPKYTPFVFLIKLGVYVRAILGGIHRLALLILPVVADGILILTALLLTQYFWGSFYFGDLQHFDANFYKFNLPLYTVVWLGFLFLSGSYDRYYSLRRLVSGFLSGTIAILVIYAMLNQNFRSSRAVILLGGIVALFLTMGLRYLTHYLRHRSFKLGKKRIKNAVVIASKGEAVRILELLNRSSARIRLVALLSPGPTLPGQHVDNDISLLQDVLSLNPVDELIFSAKDLPFSEITHWMNTLGSRYEFKIASEVSQQIVGSKSKDYLGELYSVDFEYHLAQQYHKRNKRILDIFLALMLLLLSPALLLTVSSGKQYLKNCVEVLRGKKSWVGYNTQDPRMENLPRIKKGVISVWPKNETGARNREIASIRNLLYAREYSIWKDIELFIKNWRKTGLSQSKS